MYPETNDAILLIFYLLYSLFVMAYGAYTYIGMGLGGFRMARKIGMTNPWMFWIPMANVYAMGNLADQQASLCEGRSTAFRKKMLAWNIVIICAALLFVIAMIPILVVATVHGTMDENGTVTIPEAYMNDLVGPSLFFLFSLLVLLVLSVIYLVVYYKVLYRIFKLYAPDGAVGLLILSIFVNAAIPAVFLILSGKEPALPMPARGEGESDGGNGYYTL